MATENWPTIPKPQALQFYLSPSTQIFRSPLSGAVQTLELPGARWRAIITYNALSDANARILKAFLSKLSGSAGRFYCWDFGHENPAGIGTGTPLVDGASQTGKSLDTKGWTPSQTGILKAGDYFTVNGELKIMTADVDSDVSGDATLVFIPALRASPANEAALTVIKASCTMMLINDEQDTMLFRPGIYAEAITIDAVEMYV